MRLCDSHMRLCVYQLLLHTEIRDSHVVLWESSISILIIPCIACHLYNFHGHIIIIYNNHGQQYFSLLYHAIVHTEVILCSFPPHTAL